MSLLSILLVFAFERFTGQSKQWQIAYYFDEYHNWAQAKDWLKDTSGPLPWLLIVVPALLLYLLLTWLDSGFLQFVLSTAILMICLGCPNLRATYKCFLQAAGRGDIQACSLYADQLGHDPQGVQSFGQSLVWLNYRHYMAVILWFIFFGAPGALLYALGRLFEEKQADNTGIHNMMAWLDWVPVRITSFGLLVVGHFSRALPIWLNALFDVQIKAKDLLSQVAKAAEDVEPCELNVAEEPITLVRLAKRNILFLLAFLSLLTLTGWVN